MKGYRIFYANLEALCFNKDSLKEKDLLMELNKLYGQYYNNYDSKIKKEIEDYIKNNYNDLDNFNILYNIINKFIPFANENENNFTL